MSKKGRGLKAGWKIAKLDDTTDDPETQKKHDRYGNINMGKD